MTSTDNDPRDRLLPGSAEFRRLFPILDDVVFLNSAGNAPLPLSTVEAEHSFSLERARLASLRWADWQARLGQVRARAAGFMGAAPVEVAFVANTSSGLGFVAQGLDLEEGDEVVAARPDFPSNVYPWQDLVRRGVRVRWMARGPLGRLTPDDLRPLMTKRTRLVAVSAVDYATGYAVDLASFAELCRASGALLCVDAIQQLGVMPLEVRALGVDFLAAGSHKWLLGPMGVGLLYVAERAWERMRPSVVGWKNVRDEENFRLREDLDAELKSGGLAFEPGTMNLSGVFALGASIDLLSRIGVAEIREHVTGLTDLVREEALRRGLALGSAWGPGERSAIVCVDPPRHMKAVECWQALKERGAMVAPRDGRLRLSPHGFNDASDVLRFFATLDELR